MVRYFLPLRFLMLFACLGAMVGAVLMFALAGAKLASGAAHLWASGAGGRGDIPATVMGATDAILFGIVLIIFAYVIAFGFVFTADERTRERIPQWMHVQDVSELKRTLIEVIIVYLVVDFATDLATGEEAPTWLALVKPVSIVLIAGALRLMKPPSVRDER